MTAAITLRDATDADLEAIRDIYNHAVEHTTAIWNDRTVDLADRLAWWQGRKQAGYPLSDNLLKNLAATDFGLGRFADTQVDHTLEIHPVFAEDEAQELRLESICLAGGEAKILE